MVKKNTYMFYIDIPIFQDLPKNSCRNSGFEGNTKVPLTNLKESVKKNDKVTKKVDLIPRHMLQQ